MSSTGTRKERNVQSRSNEALIEADKEFINSLKIFSEASNSTAGLAGKPAQNSPRTPAGNYLAREGDSMIGPIALGPPLNFRIVIDSANTIDIGPLNENAQYTSNVQLDSIQPNSFVLDIIANAAFDGQILVLRTFAPSTPFTISQATLANGGNIQTGDSNDLTVGDLQTVTLIFDESLIVFSNTGGTWRVLSVSSGTGGGLTEPVILNINTITPQTLPTKSTIDWSKNPNQITIDRDIEFDFSNLPTSGKYEGVLVIIDIDSTGGYASPIWPLSLTNPPIISTTALSRTSVILYTIDGGTIVTHATSVGSSSSGGTSTLSGLTIDVNKDWLAQGISNFGSLTGVTGITATGSSVLITGIDTYDFFQAGQSIQNKADPDGGLLYNVNDLQAHIFRANTDEIARFEETASGVFRLNMLDHSIRDAQDITLDNASGATVFAGTSPALGFNSVTSTLLINVPAGAKIGISENNTVGSTEITDDGVISNVITADSDLFIGILGTSPPTLTGQFTNDATDVFVFSGGASRNMSAIGVAAGGANVFLSNLTSPTSVNQNIIPQAGKLLGSSGNEWSSVHTNNLRFGTAGVISATSLQIFGDTNGMTFNIPSGSADNYDFQAGGVSKVTISDAGTIVAPIITINTVLSFNDAIAFAGSNGQIYREGSDLKVFSGGVERNMSDIGTGTFLPLSGGTMSGAINMGNNDLTAVDDIFFNQANTSIEIAANIVTHDFPSGGTWRIRELSTSRVIIDSGFRITSTTNIGVFGNAAVAQQTVTGSRGGNAALASLLTAMANFGWIVDNTSS